MAMRLGGSPEKGPSTDDDGYRASRVRGSPTGRRAHGLGVGRHRRSGVQRGGQPPQPVPGARAATAGGLHRYHVIMVDDGSVDRTAEIAESYQGPPPSSSCSRASTPASARPSWPVCGGRLHVRTLDVVVTIEADTTSDLGILDHMVSVVAGGDGRHGPGLDAPPRRRDGGRLRLPAADQQGREPGDADRHRLEPPHLHQPLPLDLGRRAAAQPRQARRRADHRVTASPGSPSCCSS